MCSLGTRQNLGVDWERDKIWEWTGNETKSGCSLGTRQNLGVDWEQDKIWEWTGNETNLRVVWERVYVCTLLNKETIIGEIEPNEVLMVCGVR